MDDRARAYVAAFIDGEGTVTIGRSRGRGREWNYRPLILCVNGHGSVIRFLREVTGVGIVYQNTAAYRDHWTPMTRWQVTGRQARALATDLLPWLVVKRAQAELVACFPAQPKGGRGPTADIAYAGQGEAFARMADLNRRGRKDRIAVDDFPRDHPLIAVEDGMVRGDLQGLAGR